MSDIQLRFGKDMLVLSAPVDAVLARQGIDVHRDREFLSLIEPEALRDALRLESLAGAQCLVTATAGITAARLAHVNMEDRGLELATAALTIVKTLQPQHVIAEIGPCGLPLDRTSAASLKQSRDQYAQAARDFGSEGIDALFLNGFADCTDLQCALMGVRMVSDIPIFASVDIDAEGVLLHHPQRIEEACEIMVEYGANVAGFACAAPSDVVCALASRLRAACSLPLLVQLIVQTVDPKQGSATQTNPYYCADVMIESATTLRGAGVQFLRAAGNATPAYTGALVAASAGFDVVEV